MFKDVEIPPLPAAVTRLIAEINQPEPDINRLEKVISSAPGIAAKVIKTVNSSLFSLPTGVNNVKHAVNLLGLRHIRSIALAFATMDALPKPSVDLFDHEAFWADSLLEATLSRALSQKHFGTQAEEAFTASLLADVALPVLLSAWEEYYEPVIKEWARSPKRLSEIEREHFGWDHAQAGAWIVRSWKFPEEMVCYIGAHNLSWDKMTEFELTDTIVVPMAVAALSPSILKADHKDSIALKSTAEQWLLMENDEFIDTLTGIKQSLREVLDLFGLSKHNMDGFLDGLIGEATNKTEQGTP